MGADARRDVEPAVSVTRRSFVLALGGAALLGPLAGSLPASAQAPGVVPTQVGSTGRLLYASTYSADWSTRTRVGFPRSWTVPKALRDRDLTAALTWDGALFEVTPLALAERAGQLSPVALHVEADGSGKFTIPRATEQIRFEAAPRGLFPAENRGTATPTTLRISNGTTNRDIDFPMESSAVAPWGAELVVVWAEKDGLATPERIVVTSVGPNPIPAGVSVVCTLPQAAADQFRADTGERRTRESRGGGGGKRGVVVYALTEAVPAGQSLTIDSAVDALGAGAPSLTAVSLVALRVPKALRDAARDTGSSSSAPVTSSGTPVSDYSAPITEEDAA